MGDKILTGLVLAGLAGLFGWVATDGKNPWAAAPGHGPEWCAEHGVAEADCSVCNPKLARGGTYTIRVREPKPGECPNPLVRIHLAEGAAAAMGLETAEVSVRPVTETIRANAETLYAPSRYARISPRMPGVVREVSAAPGQDVEAGATLAVLESPEFGAAKADYIRDSAVLRLRERTHAQEKELFEKKIATTRELMVAETALEEARVEERRCAQRLLTLGVPAASLPEIVAKEDVSPRIEVRAPFAGRVVEAAAVSGETAGPDRPLFAVADLSRLWITIDLPETDLARLARDQKVAFHVDGLPGRRFPGRLTAEGAEVDERTRTVKAYAEIKNVGGLLRARMFGRAEIAVKPPEPMLLVPKEAVHGDGDCLLAFVEARPGVYLTRQLEVGAVFEGGFEVKGGLVAGEKVVTRGSFLLKTEVLRGELGAGCCAPD